MGLRVQVQDTATCFSLHLIFPPLATTHAAATTMVVCTGRRGFHVLAVLALFVTPAWVVYKRFVATAGLSQKISTDTVPKAGRAVVTTAGLSLRKQVQHSRDSFTAGSTTLKPKEKVDGLVSDNDQPAGAACAWVVLKGDSNTRAVVDQWIGQHMYDGVEKHHTNHAGGTPSCKHTAAAQEYVVVAKSADPLTATRGRTKSGCSSTKWTAASASSSP